MEIEAKTLTKSMAEKTFGEIESPEAFSRGVVQKTFFTGEKGKYAEGLLLSELEKQKLDKILQVLEHPNLPKLIKAGKITFGAIKPKTQESKLGVADDEEGEKLLLELIKSPLEAVFTISAALTPTDVDAFYPADVKEKLSRMREGRTTVWEDFRKHMTSGPVTYFLLYSDAGHASERWRAQMGKTDPKHASLTTIRGKYALSIRKNLVHGSSGENQKEIAENVTIEVNWLKDKLKSTKEEAESANYFPSEGVLKEVGVLNEGSKFISAKRLTDFQRSGETFLAAYAVNYKDENGNPKTDYIAQKSVYSMGDPETKAKKMLQRLKFLDERGIKVPKLFGIKGADIFEEYILNAKEGDEAVRMIKANKFSAEEATSLVSELAKIAAILDKNGFKVVGNFSRNLILGKNTFYFVDAGSDLGEPSPQEPNEVSKAMLFNEFKGTDFEKTIEEVYSREREV